MLDANVQYQRGALRLIQRLQIGCGEVLTLFGPSGCGKTTTAHLIAGLLRPQHGRIVLNNEVLFDSHIGVDLPTEQRGIGYVFQDARLFPHLKVEANLTYGLSRSRRSIQISYDDMVRLLDLGSYLRRYPSHLSGGEKQRVAIGRALLSQPSLLLLDEPLAGLDGPRREEVIPYLERLRDQVRVPMLYISHQFDEVVRLATHAIIMHAGCAVAQGSLTDLSLSSALHDLLGSEHIGSIVESRVIEMNPDGLSKIPVGSGTLTVDAGLTQPGQPLRIQLLARDLILATRFTAGLSLRNQLEGSIASIVNESVNTALVTVISGNTPLIARTTRAAIRDLQLTTGMPIWVLVKSVTLRGHVYSRPWSPPSLAL